MIYLWVAAGGALGSVLRFWLNNAVAAALGAEFPWGSLLINILGSFVISFFGTLTSKVARFAVPPEISIFVMVGICGGFTTFSSFSLQTIQLARAGEWDRAFLYVLASVVLCLLVCWLGFVAAVAIPGRSAGVAIPGRSAALTTPARSAAVASQQTMFDTGTQSVPARGAVLAMLPHPETVSKLLDSARELAAIYNRPLAALHVRIDPETTIIPNAEVLTESQATEISRTQADLKTAVEREVAAWVAAHPDTGLTFLEPFGGATGETARAAQGAAALVVTSPETNPADAVILDADCPVLVMPPASGFKPSHVAIAWKDIGHARAAIVAAAPLIAQAQRISIICIGDPERLHIDQIRLLLGQHGGRVTLLNPPRGEGKLGKQLLVQAKAAGADVLVLGAARHGRLAGWVLGGVTETVLDSTDMPLFLKQ